MPRALVWRKVNDFTGFWIPFYEVILQLAASHKYHILVLKRP